MNFNFENNSIEEKGGSFLNEAGVHLEGKLIDITYEKETSKSGNNYECAVFKVETKDGASRELRVFTPNEKSIFERDIYKDGKVIGKETKEQAINRTVSEFTQKLFAAVATEFEPAKIKQATANCVTAEQLIRKCSEILNHKKLAERKPVNFILLFLNSSSKKTSNLVIPDSNLIGGVNVWIEASEYDAEGKLLPSNIKVTKKVAEGKHNSFDIRERFPYNGGNSSTSDDLGNNNSADTDDDLPF